jgi:hypothetical protein
MEMLNHGSAGEQDDSNDAERQLAGKYAPGHLIGLSC